MTLDTFRGWCGAAFLPPLGLESCWGFPVFGCMPPRAILRGFEAYYGACFSSSLGRCLGGVTSSFRASESDVRHFSWVVWRSVFATPWA